MDNQAFKSLAASFNRIVANAESGIIDAFYTELPPDSPPQYALTAEEPVMEHQQGIVFFCDGGARPNPGPAGWGVHGYLYSTAKPKKGSGNSNHVLTDIDYVLKSLYHTPDSPESKLKEITPIAYFDGYGSLPDYASNNKAELQAAINAARKAAEYEIAKLVIRTDSEYVVKGYNKRLRNWQTNGWVNQNGGPIANIPLWQELAAELKVLTNRGVKVVLKWIESHSNLLGNDRADRLATAGVMVAKKALTGHCEHRSELTTTVADGYWKSDVERHPFISLRTILFNTLSELCKPGNYYLTNQNSEVSLYGKRVSDGAYAVVRLGTPDPAVEILRNQSILAAGGGDSLIMGRLDVLYRPDTYAEVTDKQEFAFEPSSDNLDADALDGEAIYRELRPVRTAMRSVDCLMTLERRLDDYVSGRVDSGFTVTDITDDLYEITTKTNKQNSVESLKLKADFVVGFARLDVIVRYVSEGGEIRAAPVTLTLGIDLPDRNSLKRLESLEPKVSIITWAQSESFFQYATIIELPDSVGIWCGAYSNTRYVAEIPELPAPSVSDASAAMLECRDVFTADGHIDMLAIARRAKRLKEEALEAYNYGDTGVSFEMALDLVDKSPFFKQLSECLGSSDSTKRGRLASALLNEEIMGLPQPELDFKYGGQFSMWYQTPELKRGI